MKGEVIDIAAKTISDAGVDTSLLPELANRLRVYQDDAGNLGQGAGARVVRGQEPSRTPQQELLLLLGEKNMNLPTNSEGLGEDTEQRATRIINERIKALSPDGNPLRVSVNTRNQIAREVRGQLGLEPDNTPKRVKPTQPDPSPTPTGTPANFGNYGDALKAQRREALS